MISTVVFVFSLLVFLGMASSFLIDPRCHLHCNSGSCQRLLYFPFTEYCQCNPGHTGDHCEIDHSSSSGFSTGCYLHCNSGSCQRHLHFPFIEYCQCYPGHTGDHCEIDHNSSSGSSKDSNCLHGQLHHMLYCVCDQGWVGPHCDHEDPCKSSPCLNGGTCHHSPFDLDPAHHTCHCHHGISGFHCEVLPATAAQAITESTTSKPTAASSTPTTTITTTTSTILTTTINPVTTTPAPEYTCKKFETINSLALQVISSNNDATACHPGQNVSPEAFVLDYCNVTLPSFWKQGMHVMSSCSSVPVYSPIAVFVNGVYTPSSDATSGIFFGCLPNGGLKIGMQTCGTFPTIIHAENTTAIDPNGFYIIQ